jgi:hypothetical protein
MRSNGIEQVAVIAGSARPLSAQTLVERAFASLGAYICESTLLLYQFPDKA